MEFKNEFKAMVMSRGQLVEGRLAVNAAELREMWQGKTIMEMERIFCISDEMICGHVSSLLQHYCANRTVGCDAYLLMDPQSQRVLAYFYDSKVFRSHRPNIRSDLQKEESQFISSFVICYCCELPANISEVYEFVDSSILRCMQWIIKVKESLILRIYNYIQNGMQKHNHPNDIIVLPLHRYAAFLNGWMFYNEAYSPNASIGNLFKGIMVLLENQILLEYFNSLSEMERERRRYCLPIRSIMKPKNVEQFTVVEMPYGQVGWQTLKFQAFHLKYRVVEREDVYECYLLKEKVEEELEPASEEDRMIMLAFQKFRRTCDL